MAKGNILKEAIADAKAVREVALANAKAALEEAFTPKIQNMLSAKLQEDLDEDMYMDEDEENIELGEMGNMYDEDKGEEASMDEEIDLEEILNELELEEGDMTYEEEDEDIEEAVGYPNHRADNMKKVHHQADDINQGLNEDTDFDLNSLLKEINDLEEEEITEDEITEKKDEEKEKVEEGCGCNEALTELEEMKSAFNTVKSELNEVNLLNSKLLYVNRIFKANNLDDAQKLRVVETLDKADSTKEAKLIYETIKDSFSIAKTKKVAKRTARKPIKEGFKGIASKASGVSRAKKTAPKRAIINESDTMVSRFQKLANIKIK